jgi:tetratricopeptide (TPR) repeat protein
MTAKDPEQVLAQARALRADGHHEQAREHLAACAERHLEHAALQYQTAGVHDFLGLETQAVPYYRRALALGLPDELLRRVYLGLGSTYRTLGRYEDAERTLRAGLARFPQAAEIRTFLAMTLYNLGNLGRHHEAMQLLLGVIADTTSDAELRDYERAIRFYAQDLDRRWPEGE